jgi:hypothetical protein
MGVAKTKNLENKKPENQLILASPDLLLCSYLAVKVVIVLHALL